MFAPWKNLHQAKTRPGFSFEEFFARISFNIVSRLVGAMMRGTIIIGFIFMEIFFVIALPAISIAFAISLPLQYFFERGKSSEDVKKDLMKKRFVLDHALSPANTTIVEQWFELLYQSFHQLPWWNRTVLFATPPLGRDWTAGYTPTLDQFATEIGPVAGHESKMVGRSEELNRIEQILSKSAGANVILVGDEGVGKQTLVQMLANRIYEAKSNPVLVYKRILHLDMQKILAVEADFIKREEILKNLLSEAAAAKNIIIAIFDFDKYVSNDTGRVDLSSILAEYARSPSLQFLALSTPALYQKYIFQSDKIAKSFDKIDIVEVTNAETAQILLRLSPTFERKNHLIIPYETIMDIVDKSANYITGVPFPEKAIDLLDDLCSSAASQKLSKITPDFVTTLIEKKTHVPVRIAGDLQEKLVKLEELLRTRIVGQDSAVHRLTGAIQKAFVINRNRKKPLASFLFLGSTGVGKTETAKAVAAIFFGSEDKIQRFDMSLYQSKLNIPQLIGSSDSGNPGLLTESIRQNPYGVLLLDEIEKADHDLLNIFLTIFDEGYFTDGFGKRVDCKNLIIVATSNAGSDYLYKMASSTNLSGNTTTINEQSVVDYLVANKIFLPEFLNRFDEVIVYYPLSSAAIMELAHKKIGVISKDIATKKQITVNVSDAYLTNLMQKGYNPQFGARNMERIIREEVEGRLAQLILNDQAKPGTVVEF